MSFLSNPLTNKVVVLTGAASGIGRATAIHLSSLGAMLSICDIQSSPLLETFSLLTLPTEGGQTHIHSTFDISSSSACTEFIEYTVSQLGRIDHVLNCAGINPIPIKAEDISDGYWDKIINTNLKGTFAICRAGIPHLSRGSCIVNISSTLGLHGRPLFATYCASKFAVIGFSKALALELGERGIRVNVVAPGYIETPTNSGVVAGVEERRRLEAEVPLGRMGEAKEVSELVGWLMSSGASYITGSVFEVDGGLGAGRL
jgi:NAD(P)-dependent dehydrogenase (short-subunit alcohol dehydrogenase family)